MPYRLAPKIQEPIPLSSTTQVGQKEQETRRDQTHAKYPSALTRVQKIRHETELCPVSRKLDMRWSSVPSLKIRHETELFLKKKSISTYYRKKIMANRDRVLVSNVHVMSKPRDPFFFSSRGKQKNATLTTLVLETDVVSSYIPIYQISYFH